MKPLSDYAVKPLDRTATADVPTVSDGDPVVATSSPTLYHGAPDLEAFVQPKIYYNEITIAPGGTAEIQQELYKLSEKMLVDYLWVGEETMTVNGAVPAFNLAVTTHASRLSLLDLWWYVSTRRESALRLRNAYDYYNFAEAKRWSVYDAMLPPDTLGGPPLDGSLVWRFLRPWRYVPGCGLVIEWDCVSGALLPAGALPSIPPVDVVLSGIGIRSKHRRIFELRMPMIDATNAATFAATGRGSFTDSEFIMNQTNEPYDVDTLTIRLQSQLVPPVTWTDARSLHMVRYRIRPTIGKPFSEDPIPLAVFGVDNGPLRGIHYQPTGGPLILEEGSTVGWRFTNNATGDPANLRVQVALIGRTLPGRW